MNLTKEASEELDLLARRVGTTKTDLVKLSLGLIRIVIHEKGKGNRVAVISRDHEILKEVLLPF